MEEKVEERIKKIEKWIERSEREERKRNNNIIIRGIEVKKGKRKEAVEDIMKWIEVKLKVEEVLEVCG